MACYAFPKPADPVGVVKSLQSTYCDDGLNGTKNCKPVHPASDPIWEWLARLKKLDAKLELCKQNP